MNYRIITYVIGWVLNLEAICMTLPAVTGLIYGEKTWTSFLITGLISALAGTLLVVRRPEKPHFFMKEGCVSVALSWIALSLIGSLPFMISGTIPHFVDALFETVSGFTTTGASIMASVEDAPRCILMWRSFTHWIGGMGVLVLLLSIIKMSGGSQMNLMKAESPGPSVSRLAPTVRSTAKILYTIYLLMTVLEIVILLLCGMPIFDALTTAFGTAGTGGFGIKNDSMGGYSVTIQIVVTVFMILFGINFNVYFLLLSKKWKQALKNEEVRWYLAIILGASGAGKSTVLNILGGMDTNSEGSVVIDGRDISNYSPKQLTAYRRTDIGFVFQFYNLVANLTAKENVELASQIVSDAQDAVKVLEDVGLGDRVDNFPAQLSGGEQQRVAIARAVAKNPKILLCDEPTGALDYNTGKQVLQILQDMSRKKGATVVIVTHNSAIAPIADRVIRMHDGKVTAVDVNEHPMDIAELEW